MAQEHCFDIVSKVNLQEVRNAVNMAQKEITTRFDFRASRAGVVFEESPVVMKLTADHQAQLNSVKEVIDGKLAKRGVSLKAFVWKDPEPLPSGGMKRQASLQQGLSSDQARAIAAFIKQLGLKVQPRIEGDTVRVAAKQIDDLQAIIQALKTKEFGVPIQVDNYR